jgi:putative phosphoesterase
MKKLGFNLLVNENRKITINNESIYIAGVTDLWHGNPDAEKALEGIKKEDFVLFLTHNPEYFEDMTEAEKEKTDMILAGHSHAGQITFFGKIIVSAVKNKEKYGYGMKNYGGHKLYITSGVGGAALEMFIRFFAQPEIVIFELKRI